MRPIEVGLQCDQPAHLFFEDEPLTMRLLAFNGTDQPLTPRVCYEVYDYRNRRIDEGSQSLDVAARSTYRGRLDLPAGRRGSFRVVLWADGQSGPDEEVIYAVVPRPQRAGPDPSSLIGVHALASDFQYAVLERLGVKWTRILSPEAWFRWHAIEPAPGQFVWYDAAAEQAVRHGFQILGTIGTNEWPKWAYRAGQPDLDAWEQSVGKIVGHYRRWVKHWEVWNEPIHNYTAEFYAEMLRRAGRAIRAADPQAKIVGLGGSYRCAWCLDVIERLGGRPQAAMDYLSTHLYPAKADPLNPLSGAAAAEFREKIIGPHKLEVWNTEAGAWCQGFYQGARFGLPRRRRAGVAAPRGVALLPWIRLRGDARGAELPALDRQRLHALLLLRHAFPLRLLRDGQVPLHDLRPGRHDPHQGRRLCHLGPVVRSRPGVGQRQPQSACLRLPLRPRRDARRGVVRRR